MPSDAVVLDRGDYTSCTVNLHGANVTSWRINNKEQIFVSTQSKYNEQACIRGGIVLIYPRYGEWEFGPECGFSRTIRWTLEKAPKVLPNDDIEATFSLEDNDYTRSMWNYKFKVTNKITLKERELVIELAVKNTSKHLPMNFQVMIHTHVRVPDVTKCKILGLKGCDYKEITFANPEKFVQEDEVVEFTEYINRCYVNTSDELAITDIMLGKVMKLRKTGFPEIVIWNPWEETSKVLEYFDANDYLRMVTVEASRINDDVHLEPGEEFHGKLELEICEPEINTG